MSADTRPERRSGRPWLLIAAALLLAVLSATLLTKWRESRTRADELQAELKQVYAEAESLRTRATQAEQRIAELERDVRTLSARQAGAKERRPAAKAKSGTR